MSTIPSGPEWLAYLTAELGTNKWVVASRLTERLKDKGHTLAVTPKRYKALQDAYNTLQSTAKTERIALALFPDDYHDGHDCRSYIGMEGQPCPACADKLLTWRNRIQAVTTALTAEGLL